VQTVFVTGAEGFTGRQALRLLTEHGYTVVAGVRNRARKLAFERENTAALVCDVRDPINVARVIASVRPDAVVHLAGVAQPAYASDEPLDSYQSIVSAWANVLDAVRRTSPRARVVLASACEVYGNAGADGRALTEDTPPQPVHTYGSLKRTAETIAQTFHRDYHLDVMIARPFHYTGMGQSDGFFFAAIAERLATWNPDDDGDALQLPDLDCCRELLHVDDVVAAYAALLRHGKPNEIYNIATGQSQRCRDLVQRMLDAYGLDLALEPLPVDDDHGQVQHLRGDNAKITEHTDWRPTQDATAALTDLCASYRTAPQPALH
jgi:nucleoside-diphosphate-sugar epimerase